MEKIIKRLSMLLFLGFLLTMSIITLVSPKEEFSDVENRTLAAKPELSLESYFDASYSKGLEQFMCDHFYKRSDWIKLMTHMELFSGKLEVNGVYITENRHIERLSEPDFDVVDETIDAINEYASEISTPVYFMLAPSSAGIYADELDANAPQYNQESFIDYVYANVDDNIRVLDIFMTLKSADEEYIYYKNDHHWTSLGAYYAYYYAISKLGFTPVSFSQYNIERVSSSFYGSLYSETLYEGFGGDYVDIFNCDSGIQVKSVSVNDGIKLKEYDSLYFREFLEKKDKYSMFLGGNFPIVDIETDAQSGKSLLLIKDSYANCFVPFLTQHYSKITVVDMRYINIGLENFVSADDYSQVLLLYNASGFANDTDLKKIT